MDRIRIENLRSLKDTGWVDIKPITLLLGRNSSGKSSFLRLFPLLRQSLETPTTGPILWNGRLVDFGSFAEAVYKSKEKNTEITLSFEGQIGPGHETDDDPSTNWNLRCEIWLSNRSANHFTYLKKVKVNYMGHELIFSFSQNPRAFKTIINNEDFSYLFTDHSELPHALDDLSRTSFRLSNLELLLDRTKLAQVFQDFSKEHLTHDMFTIIESIYSQVTLLLPDKKLLQSIKSPANRKSWKDIPNDWTLSSKPFTQFRNYLILYRLNPFLRRVDHFLNQFSGIRYLAPIRATAQRYYRIQDLAVNDIDFRGENLAMFLRSLSPKKREALSNWTDFHFDFKVSSKITEGHFFLELHDGDKNTNLADMGFGYSQLLPIVTQLWVLISDKGLQDKTVYFAIEQPELHLHPALQAKLADCFAAAIETAKENRIDLRLIIETHSQEIVNRFGNRIAEKENQPEDINVVIFEKNAPSEPTHVKISGYDENGYLTNWPYGFFQPDMV
ncbi:AAA family ATPase [Acanthopleuribacter pedis]|uniref:AAA family ATPase n=1 Tax=Acanthopleuribacter pedis TaxID=442870 RepID=A0A8J7U150_9BACT|nr:AAA family ATPase [Acanthopleuribacter pedis]MBO1317793.1 AAA family ATPase [Acanthopleuribacter pedis]